MSTIYDHGGNIFEFAERIGCRVDEISDFSASINPAGLSSAVRKSITDALELLVHYPDHSCEALKNLIAAHHSLNGNESIAIANGSTELIYRVSGIISGNRALLVSPSFSEYEKALLLNKWSVEHFVLKPEDDFSFDFNRFEEVVSSAIDAVYICNPGNPYGRGFEAETIDKIHSICSRYGAFLVIDEAFADYCEELSSVSLLGKTDNIVIIRSMTKFYAIPGLRLGYALSSPRMTERLEKSHGPWGVNTLALAAGEAALSDADFRINSIELNRSRREELAAKLSKLGALKVYPSSANFLLLELTDTETTATALKLELLKQKILIRECASFTGLNERFFRVAVRGEEENRRLVSAIEVVLKK